MHMRDLLDDTGGLWCLRTLADCPRADLDGTTGEVADEVQAGVTRLCDLPECAGGADLLLFLRALFVRHANQALLQCDGEGDERVTGVVLVDPGLDLREPVTDYGYTMVKRRRSACTYHLFFLRM